MGPRLIGIGKGPLVNDDDILLSLFVVPCCADRRELIASAIGSARGPTVSRRFSVGRRLRREIMQISHTQALPPGNMP